MIDYEALNMLAARLMRRRKAHPLRETGYIYRHGRRTAMLAVDLRRRILGGDDDHDDALRVAALFHDIGKGIEPHEKSGEALVRAFLPDYLPPAVLEEVAALISEHTNHQTDNPWAMLLQDADLLDHFGTVEIGLSFQYGAYNGEGMEATVAWYRTDFLAYAARTRTRIRYAVSRDIFDEKVAFTRAFTDRLEAETAGAFWSYGTDEGGAHDGANDNPAR